MALTRSKGNMYSWVTHVWSPIRGCQYECDYCYVKKYGYSSKPELRQHELEIGLGKGKTIFVGHLCDMWGPWIPNEWIGKILVKCYDYPENTYVFQSKNPARFKEFLLGEVGSLVAKLKKFPSSNIILGTTIETDEYPKGFKTKAPPIKERFEAMRDLKWPRKFVTIEPIMEFGLPLLGMIFMIRPEFVTIGADSKGHNLAEPSWSDVQMLINELTKFTEIRQKTNLERLRK